MQGPVRPGGDLAAPDRPGNRSGRAHATISRRASAAGRSPDPHRHRARGDPERRDLGQRGATGLLRGARRGGSGAAARRRGVSRGGERQRIAIARAILNNSPILLLDEATSALDAESEQAIRHALANLMKGRTVIAIAHRLSTLQDFDRIVVLDGGRIAQDGSPDKLTHLDGFFRELMKKESMAMALAAA